MDNSLKVYDMITMNFQQALQGVGSELFAIAPKLPLPKSDEGKNRFDTPYLRRRMRSRSRGFYG